MAKLRHVAMSVSDPDKTADFYCEAFDMKRVGSTDSPDAKGVYVSDGVITMALLNFKNDDQGHPDYVGLHHIGFWVDELEKQKQEKIYDMSVANAMANDNVEMSIKKNS